MTRTDMTAHKIKFYTTSEAGSIVNSTICSSIFCYITVFRRAHGIGGMCKNMHAVPVSSYFMFVILVLLTLGLIQYGEPQQRETRPPWSCCKAFWGYGSCLAWRKSNVHHQDVHLPGRPVGEQHLGSSRGQGEAWWDMQVSWGDLWSLVASQCLANTCLLSEQALGHGPS